MNIHEAAKKVLSIPSIPQRTPEWYAARHDLITASACADVLNENPYHRSARQDLLNSKGKLKPTPSISNIFTIHGTRFEPVATLLYSILFKETVYDVGLYRHPELSFLGASPDGICARGAMLEIKCPLRRKIKKSGLVRGTIVPVHYWIQVQVQLEVCDMEECDFWQCAFSECQTFEEWCNWVPSSIQIIARQPLIMELDDVVLRKGIFVVYKDGVCEYPENLFSTKEEWSEWLASATQMKEVEKITYWCLQDCFNQPVQRDRSWFTSVLPQFRVFWDEVEELRAKGGPAPLSFF